MEFKSVTVIMGAVSETDDLIRTVEGIIEKTNNVDIAEIIIAYPENKVTDECRYVLEMLKSGDYGVRLDIFAQATPGIGFFSDAFDRATGSHCIPFQSDMGMELDIIPQLIEKAKSDPDTIYTTSRWLPGCIWTGYGRIKKIVNYAAQIFLRMLFGGGLTDYTNPVQIIPVDIYRKIKWEFNDFSRFLEMQLKPVRLGYKFAEIPTNCYDRTEGHTSNSSGQIFNYLKAAIKIRTEKIEDIILPQYLSDFYEGR